MLTCIAVQYVPGNSVVYLTLPSIKQTGQVPLRCPDTEQQQTTGRSRMPYYNYRNNQAIEATEVTQSQTSLPTRYVVVVVAVFRQRRPGSLAKNVSALKPAWSRQSRCSPASLSESSNESFFK